MNLVEAAALLVGVELRDAINDNEWRVLQGMASRRGAGNWERDLVRAVQSHTLIAESVAIRDLTARAPKQIDARAVSVADLLEPWACRISDDAFLKWCVERGAPIPAQLLEIEHEAAHKADYPEVLQAAVDAFAAVHDDDDALRGKTAKQALQAWLVKHRPKLSKNARTLAAEVANWQRKGGAPKTPTRKRLPSIVG